jgi:cell division septum initiation protein DivIVA
MRRFGEIEQLQAMNAQLQQQIKELQGDLQTAQRESIADRKRVEVQKFKSKLDSVASDAKADKRISANELTTKVMLESERLQNAISQQRDAMIGSMEGSPVPDDAGTS